MLIKTLFPGVYVFARKGKIRPIYAFAKGNLADGDGAITTRFIIQSINDASAIQPESAPMDITKNVVCLVEAPDGGLHTLWAPCAGKAFTKADLAAHPSVQALIPDETTTYHLMVLPRCLPILFGQSETHRGPVDETCSALLEENLTGCSSWAEWLSAWDKDLSDAVAALVDSNPKAMGEFLPTLAKAALPLSPSLIAQTETLYADEDDAEPAMASLRKVLFKVVPAAGETPPPQSIDPGRSDELSDNDLDSVPAKIPRKKTANHFSDEEQLAVKFRLRSCGYDEKTGALTIPELTTDMENIFFSGMSNSRRCDHLEQLLASPKHLEPTDIDFLHRVLDMPAFDKATVAFLANTKVATSHMFDMDGPYTKLRCFMFAPDDDATAKFRETVSNAREIEMLVGEESTNLTKMRTDIIFNQRVLFPDVFLGLLANLCYVYEKTVVVDLADWDAPTNPLGYRFFRQLALFVTNVPFRSFAKTCPRPTLQRVMAWLLQMCDQVECLLNEVPTCLSNPIHALRGDANKIRTDALRSALALKNEILDRATRIVTNTESVPGCNLNTSIDNKLAKRKMDEQRKTEVKTFTEADIKRIKAEAQKEVAKMSFPDTSGCLVYDKPGNMPSIAQPDPKKRLCAAYAREGFSCKRRGGKCPMIHNKHPPTWPLWLLKPWLEQVDKTEGLSWSASVDVPALKAKVAASESSEKPAAEAAK